MPRRNNKQPGGSGNTNTNSRKAQMLARLQKKRASDQKTKVQDSIVQKSMTRYNSPTDETNQDSIEAAIGSNFLGFTENTLHKRELALSETLKLKHPDLRTTERAFIALLEQVKKEDKKYQDMLKICKRNDRQTEIEQAINKLSQEAKQVQTFERSGQIESQFFGKNGLHSQYENILQEQGDAQRAFLAQNQLDVLRAAYPGVEDVLKAAFEGLDSEPDEVNSATSSAAARQRLNIFSDSQSDQDASPKQERRRMLPRAK